MNDYWGIYVLIVGLALAFGGLVGNVTKADKYTAIIEECRAEFNVYQCEMQPKPVSKPVWTNKPKAEVL